jgi:hypothetical protein
VQPHVLRTQLLENPAGLARFLVADLERDTTLDTGDLPELRRVLDLGLDPGALARVETSGGTREIVCGEGLHAGLVTKGTVLEKESRREVVKGDRNDELVEG